MAEYSSPAGVIPKLNALMHRWQSRKGRPAADEGSLPLGREATRGERYAASNVQRDIDASERPNPLDILMGGIGPAQAMFLGPMAKFAPLDRSSKAQDLANKGMSAEEIYKATGAGHGALPGISFGKEGLPRWEISDKMAGWTPEVVKDLIRAKTVSGNLGDMLSHPTLFQNYPHLADLKVRVDPLGRGGSFNYRTGEIDVRGSQTDALSSLLHEIQHAIQEKEGFARGGNWEMMQAAATQRAVELDNRITAMEREFFRRNKMPEYLGDLTDAEVQKYDAFRKTPTYKKMQDEWFKLTANLENEDEMFRLYRRLAGEAEARSTQARAHMSLPERAAIHPLETEAQDIPRSLQILNMR